MVSRNMGGGLGLIGDWDLGEDLWKDGMDANLLKLSTLVQGGALALVSATPGTPTQGQVYLFSQTHPTNPNSVAVYDEGAWVYYPALKGWMVYDNAEEVLRQFDGTAWVEFTSGGGGGGGIPEAPVDGKVYGRKDAAWAEVTSDPATPFVVTAVGTGAAQNITLPVSGLVPKDVLVFNNANFRPFSEYSISGTTLTITSHAAGDTITITDNRTGGGGAGAGTGGNGWTDLTFAGPSAGKWNTGGGLNPYYQSAEVISASIGDIIEIELLAKRTAAQGVALALSPDSEKAYVAMRQADNNLVYYRFATSAGGASVINGGVSEISGAFFEQLIHRVIVTDPAGSDIQISRVENGTGVIKGAAIAASLVPLVGSSRVWITIDDLAKVGRCRYRVIPRNGQGGTGSGGSGKPWYLKPKPASYFSQVSSDGVAMTLTDDEDLGLLIDGGPTAAGDKHRFAYKALADKNVPWSITAKVSALTRNIATSSMGLGLRDSISGRFYLFCLVNNNGEINLQKWNTLGSYSSTVTNPVYVNVSLDTMWYRIESDGTNLNFYFSHNGKQWLLIQTLAITEWLTNKPDLVGLNIIYNRAAGGNIFLEVPYFELTGGGL